MATSCPLSTATGALGKWQDVRWKRCCWIGSRGPHLDLSSPAVTPQKKARGHDSVREACLRRDRGLKTRLGLAWQTESPKGIWKEKSCFSGSDSSRVMGANETYTHGRQTREWDFEGQAGVEPGRHLLRANNAFWGKSTFRNSSSRGGGISRA